MEWYRRNHVPLNVSKTEEMVINSHSNSRLNWKTNKEAVYKKGMRSLCLLRRLRSFNVYSKII